MGFHAGIFYQRRRGRFQEVILLEKTPQDLYKFELMKTIHDLDYPTFDVDWPWAGASVLLTTDEHLFLVKRSFDMPTHRGQMGFFAGHKTSFETHPFEAARREFSEESGLSSETIRCEGLLSPVYTAREQAIVPVIARLSLTLEEFMATARSNGEWTDLIAVPWKTLSLIENWEWGWRIGKIPQKVLLLPLPPSAYLHQRAGNQETFLLWGATARMVWEYLSLYYRPR